MSYDSLDSEKSNFEQSCLALSILPSHQRIIISIERQRLFTFNQNTLHKEFIISTSEKPPSCQENSFGTPLGLHKVAEKIGDNAPLGTVFKGRKAQGFTYQDAHADDSKLNLITTRIMRLKGLDPSINLGDPQDTYNRYIYIHGTNHESRLGTPFSKGCIEISNSDCIELYDWATEETLVWIQ